MATIQDETVVLARLDYSETSQVLVLFTRRHGKVRAIAKGIRRGTKTRFAPGMDLLDMGHVVARSRVERSANLATVTEWKQTRSSYALRQKLFRLRGAEYAAEIAGHLTEDWDPNAELFDALVAVLGELGRASEPLRPIVRYQLQLLAAIGSLPRFDACVLCGRSDGLTHFSSFEGGMICRHCEPAQVEKREMAPATVRICAEGPAHPALAPPASPSRSGEQDHVHRGPEPLIGVFGTLNYHIAHLMGREPRLASFIVPPARRRIIE